MKRITLFVATLTVALFSSCIVDYKSYYEYKIKNFSEVDFIIHTEFAPNYDCPPSSVPETQLVRAKDITNWPDGYSSPDIISRHNQTFSFIFFNDGVVHTFSGDMAENDFRYIQNWEMKCRPSEENPNVEVYTFTYTFTQEDYERIMALHK